MNVYDFDKTIYDGDSTLDFYFYCLKKDLRLLKYLPVQILGFLKYMFGFVPKLKFKESFYSFLKGLKNPEKSIEDFWKLKESGIKNWYKDNKKEDDVIISASPEFILKPICKKLGIKHLIASDVDIKTGKCLGENCYGEEKVKRFREVFKKEKVNNFYSDSLSDSPMAELAEKSFIVSGEKLTLWGEYKMSTMKKIKKTFFSAQFIAFVFVGCINALNGIIFAALFSAVFDPNLAFVCGYAVSLTISYLLNSFLVFKENMNFSKYVKFCISYIPNFIIQNICVVIFYNLLSWNKILVYALAAIIGVPVTFILTKFFAFKKGGKTQEEQTAI